MKKILTVNKLSKIYHSLSSETLAIKDISFSVDKGEFISIVGPSGCGKSTILSILSGLLDSSGGEIKLDNASMSYMLQSDCLLPYLTILDNCLIGLKIQKKLNDNSKKYVVDLLKTYGLQDFIYKYPNNLSGGMRQRVG